MDKQLILSILNDCTNSELYHLKELVENENRLSEISIKEGFEVER